MVAYMKSLCFSFIVLTSFATLFSVADAHRFYVGGNGAWVVNPDKSYKSWAESNRFQVNDTLYFKYAKGSDSVQLVKKADYDGCNITNPIDKFNNGETEVALGRSGYFYFISGNQDHCQKGQKLTVAVLNMRNNPKEPISPAKAPSTAQPPKSRTPVSPIAPAKAPSTTQPPKAHSPISPTAPAKSPATSQPPKSSVSPSHPSTPSPAVSPSKSPAWSPSTHSPPRKSPSPSISPRSSPSPKSPAAAPPTPRASSPVKPPTSSPLHSPASPAPEKTPTSSPTPTADNNNMAPAPSPKSAATVVTVTSVMSTLFGAAFTVLMFA